MMKTSKNNLFMKNFRPDNKTDFKLFLNDIALGLFTLVFILFLCNLSGVFNDNEVSSRPELMWRSLVKRDSVNTAKIIFSGNSQSYFMNPIIIDSVTKKSSHFFGFADASIAQLSWFFSNSWDYLNPELVVLETHSFKSALSTARTKLDSIRYKRWPNDPPRFIPWSNTKLIDFPSEVYHNKDAFIDLFNPFTRNYSLIEYAPGLLYKGLFPSEKEQLKGFAKSNRFPISDSLLNQYSNGWNPFPDTPVDLTVLPIVKKLIKDCQSKGIKVLIYESPMYYKHFADQKKRNMQLDSFCKQLNIPFVNLNLEPSLTRNPNYFEDTKTNNQHLTAEGGDAVSKVLANKIKQLIFSIKGN
jgi:hypothetical protein